MYSILERHLDGEIIGFVLSEEDGEIMYFDSEEEAEAAAKEYCAFDYEIV
jgi:hypothetical protein